jgi:hypothetical protein
LSSAGSWNRRGSIIDDALFRRRIALPARRIDGIGALSRIRSVGRRRHEQHPYADPPRDSKSLGAIQAHDQETIEAQTGSRDSA